MIIFSGSGRFGNQIFQLYFLEYIRKPHEKVIAYGMESVLQYMTGFIPFKNRNTSKYYWLYDKIFLRSLKYLAKLHIINSELEFGNIGYTKSSKGILPITLFMGYVQTDKYIEKCPNKDIKLKQKYIDNAKFFLKPYENMKKIFIHIRHGDYNEDMRLPDIYYSKSFQQLKSNKALDFTDTLFVLMGDDPDYYKGKFNNLPNKIISYNDPVTDYAIMQECDGAIISNSTFAWLGAYFCKNTLPVYAPKYWTNWKEKEWYPLDIGTSKFTFIDW